MKLDFSELKENAIMKEGEHDLVIKSAKECKSSNGTNMLKLGFEDEDGAFAMDNICLEGPGAFKAKQFFKALGLDDDQVEGMEPSDLVGMQVHAVTSVEEYNGEDRARILKYTA